MILNINKKIPKGYIIDVECLSTTTINEIFKEIQKKYEIEKIVNWDIIKCSKKYQTFAIYYED